MSVKMIEKESCIKPATKRKAQKAATRKLLKQVALRCFAEKGYRHTQIADITERAGVAHGTFYVHFANKEALIEELLEEFNRALAERFTMLLKEMGSQELPSLVRRLAETFLDTWFKQKDFVKAYAQKAALGTTLEDIRDGINPPMMQLLVHALQRIAAPSCIAPDTLELVAHGLLALWMRIGLQALFRKGFSRKQAEETLVRMTVGALQETLFSRNITKNQNPKKEVR